MGGSLIIAVRSVIILIIRVRCDVIFLPATKLDEGK